eukprot:Clim_evm25s151 gene=Clim_evmTU25s151
MDMKIGNHCAVSHCNQLDFLPYKCDACSLTHCHDHHRYDAHNCEKAYLKNKKAAVCPICNEVVPQKAGQAPDAAVDQHIAAGCKNQPQKQTYTNACSHQGCKKREAVPIKCATCRQQYCLKHRFENDHACKGSPQAGRRLGGASGSANCRQSYGGTQVTLGDRAKKVARWFDVK